MKVRFYIIVATFLTARAAAGAQGAPAQATEYQIKAAFIYNFIKFTDWPKDKLAESNEITIGIIGEDPFGSAFDAVGSEPIKDKKLIIKRFGKFRELCRGAPDNSCLDANSLKKCHLLFVCKSEKTQVEQIIGLVSRESILTIGEFEGFIEAGGIINFVPSEKKIAFEINAAAAQTARIQISSRVLRLAKRVTGQGKAEKSRQVMQAQLQVEIDDAYSKLL